jgi:hypothetical protein
MVMFPLIAILYQRHIPYPVLRPHNLGSLCYNQPYTSIYEAGNIRCQESHCTDSDSYDENDTIQSCHSGKHDSG